MSSDHHERYHAPPPPPPRRQQRGTHKNVPPSFSSFPSPPSTFPSSIDDAVKSTADDAILAKLSCVEMGYRDDPFVRPMARGARGLSSSRRRTMFEGGGGGRRGGGDSAPGCDDRSSSSQQPAEVATEPIIRRGTHARVMVVERAVDSFLALTSSSSSTLMTTTGGAATRQVVVLGAGRDTTYLRYRFGTKEGCGSNANTNTTTASTKTTTMTAKATTTTDLDGVGWYEVDHPSIVRRKATSWLPGCVPDGYRLECEAGDNDDDDDGGGCSYSIHISKRADGDGGDHSDDDDASSNYYRLVGRDLRSPPSALFDSLTRMGYDRSLPTLFVLECVLMYLPDDRGRELLRGLASSSSNPSSSSSSSHVDPFVAVAVYDPIPSEDGFGRSMVDNLRRAGIVARGGQQRGGGTDDDDDEDRNDNGPIGLTETLTLSDQLSRLVASGFDVAAGCDMMDAYDHGVVRAEDRRRAMRCEMLDELEEFVLLMRHYCVVVGVSRCPKEEGGDTEEGGSEVGLRLCSTGEDSPMGFREGRCTVVLNQKN